MFRKIVSNIAFSPTIVGQLGFYAKRLRKEEATRRIGLIFTALALVVQTFAVFTPPESANASNGNDIVYGGFKNKEEFLTIYDRNKDSAGHKDLQQIYGYFGITRQDVANAKWSSFNSLDYDGKIQSVGRSTYSFQRDPHKIPDTSSTVYSSSLHKFDSTSWTTKHGSSYTALVGKRAIDGKWFAIMSGCGNPAYTTMPPPPPKPIASCTSLAITPISRTKFSFTSKAKTSNGATISGYTYTIKNSHNSTVLTKLNPSTSGSNTMSYDFGKDDSYSINVTVTTSLGQKTSNDCQKSLVVSPEPRCPLNSDLTQANPDCKPCESDKNLWYKDQGCHSEFVLTKKVKNTSQLISDANNTTANAGDRLEYRLSVKNVGKTTGVYTLQDNIADVLEYADLIDAGGGIVSVKNASTPIEKVGIISWPVIEIKPGETIEKIVSVQIMATIPATPQSTSNPESYNCQLVNDFSGNHTTILVNCPAPKVVEQIITELPHTGATENVLFGGGILSIVTYFYLRSRQIKKEVRLIRRDLNSGTI